MLQILILGTNLIFTTKARRHQDIMKKENQLGKMQFAG